MSEIIPVKKDQVLAKIAPYYHPIFDVIINEHIMPNEQILFVADTTRHTVVDQEGISVWKMLSGDYDVSTHKDVIKNQGTLLIVTNSRWVKWSLDEYTRNYSIEIEKNGNWKFEWVTPPADFPHQWLSKNKKKVSEYVAERIVVVKLVDVVAGNRREFKIRNKHTIPPSELHLVRFPTGDGVFYSLRFDDGISLHRLLQIASMNNGIVPVGTRNENDNLQKLRQLKSMFDNNLITQQEYETKKMEILSRM